MGRSQVIRKISCLQTPAHLDTPANPQVKVPQNLGDEASCHWLRCYPDWMPHNEGGEGQVRMSEPVVAGDEGQSQAAESGT